MARARIAVVAAVVLILAFGATALAAPGAVLLTDGSAQAAVAWPASTGLLIAEVVTGGASASDEYVELTNASSAAIDLAGIEVAYVTSTGGTVTRKATWPATTLLGPGRHLLIANSTGVFGASADAAYSGGFAATGGAVVVRPIGGQPIDAVAWGDATNGFVEGSVAPAPPAGSSIERRPGGVGGNVTDTNDNGADLVVNGAPVAQNLASVPVAVPGPGASPTPTPAPVPTATPLVTPEPTPVPTPAPTPTATPVVTPAPSAPAEPSPTPSPTPVPTPSPTPVPTPAPTPVPTPVPPISIAAARAMADGAEVSVEGTLTTNLGVLESARGGFIQDTTGGIALYLDAAFGDPIPAGMLARVTGTLDSRFAQRTIRVDRDDVTIVAAGTLPAALVVSTAEASEPLEGLRIELTGIVTETPGLLSDGLGITIDDGSGAIRVVAGPAAIGGSSPAKGSIVVARGPLGQRDSSGTGLEGYRLNATLDGELAVTAPPTPSPTPTPTPAPTAAPSATPAPTPLATPTAEPSTAPSTAPSDAPTPTPTVAPTPTAAPSSTPTPTPSPSTPALTAAAARAAAIGSTVLVRGVVVAEAGRLGTPAVLVIADATGGLPVHLADGDTAPARGTLLEVLGVLADPYGQLEIRPARGGATDQGTGLLPAATVVGAGAIGESTEGRLVTVSGTIAASATRSTSGDITLSITGAAGGTLRILADASAGIDPSTLRKGVTATFSGVAGQRATHKGALDGYRVWLRDQADVTVTSQPSPKPSPTPKPTPTPKGGPTPKPSGAPSTPAPISIRSALLRDGQRVTVEGVLTIGTNLLDASGRRTILEDGGAAIELYLAAPDAAMRLGTRVRVTGTIGRAWGAPRLRAEETRVLGSRQPAVHRVRSAPTAAVEWRLVKIDGTVVDVHKNGDRWSAEVQLGGGAKVPVSGLAGSGIPSTAMVEGRRATVVGIVKRPYPTATDRRFAIVPRRSADIVLGKPVTGPAASAAPAVVGTPAPGAGGSLTGAAAAMEVADVDLRDLAVHVGQRVRVGGLVTDLTTDGVRLDDGTSGALILLQGDAADLLAVLEAGDALNATGTPDQRDETVLVVAGAADVELVGDLGGGSREPTSGDTIALAALTVEGSGAPTSVQNDARTLAAATGMDPVAAGIATLILGAAAASALALAARRQRARRLLRTRIAARLEAFGRGTGRAPGGPDRALEPPIGPQSGTELGRNVRGSA